MDLRPGDLDPLLTIDTARWQQEMATARSTWPSSPGCRRRSGRRTAGWRPRWTSRPEVRTATRGRARGWTGSTRSCSKCRIARDQLDAAGVEYRLRRYLDDPPSAAELRAALRALGLEPWDVTRMSEPLARELGLREMERNADVWIQVLVEHPRLIQRPLVLTDDGRAWVARDDETLTEVVAAARRRTRG